MRQKNKKKLRKIRNQIKTMCLSEQGSLYGSLFWMRTYIYCINKLSQHDIELDFFSTIVQQHVSEVDQWLTFLTTCNTAFYKPVTVPAIQGVCFIYVWLPSVSQIHSIIAVIKLKNKFGKVFFELLQKLIITAYCVLLITQGATVAGIM